MREAQLVKASLRSRRQYIFSLVRQPVREGRGNATALRKLQRANDQAEETVATATRTRKDKKVRREKRVGWLCRSLV